MKKILNGIIRENPIFVLTLGLCSSLAVTNTFENAYMMGLCVIVVLIISNLIISLIKRFVVDSIRIPVYILIIGTLVTIIEILLAKYAPELSDALSIYISLIVVNCIVLGRAISVASKESVKNTLLDSIGIGIGYTLALMLIAAIREILGTNSLTIMNNISSLTGYKLSYKGILPATDIFPLNIFTTPAGAFLTLAFLIALFNFIKEKRHKNGTN